MSSYIVTASTSVVLLDTSILGSGQSAIVLLSSLMPPGRNIAVRDSLGYLSSPQSIIVSTTRNVYFADGTSSIKISQPFATLSFSSRDSTSWNVVNTFGFPLYDTVANVKTLTASTITGTSISIGGNLSTSAISADSFQIRSTSQVLGPAFVSTLVVGTQPSISIPYETNPGYSAYIVGATNVSSNLNIGGNLTVTGSAAFQSSVTIAGALNVNQGLRTGGDLLIAGNLQTTGNGLLTCQTANILSSLNVLGPVLFNQNAVIQSTLTVTGTTTLGTVGASTVQINTAAGGYLQLGTSGPILQARTDILPGQTVASWNSPIYTPFLSTGTLQTTGNAYIQTLQVTSTINGATVSQFLLGSTIIQNPGGSLVTSSINTNTLTLSNTLTVNTLQTSNLQASTIQVQNGIFCPTGYFSTANLVTSTFAASQISTGNIQAGVIQTPSVFVSSLTVSQTINGGTGFTALNIPSTSINNSQGSFVTGAMYTTALTASTLTVGSGIIQSTSNITILAPSVQMNALTVSSLTTSTMTVSSLTATRLTVGGPLTPGSNGPFFVPAATSTNVITTGGPGDYLSPYFISNVVPPGQNPAVPYTSFINFDASYPGTMPPGLVIGYTATLFWGGQTASYLSIGSGPTLYGTYGSDQTATGTLPISSFQLTGTLYGNSAMNVTFAYQYSPNITSIDSNAVIEFNNGYMRWNYALNGTTIQNSLNDISTRNLYYYGSLNFASDPRIKEDIQDADLERCYDTIGALPLRRYKYIDSYCSTFQVSDAYRLGFLATDLLPHFPKSVHESDTLFPEFSKSLLTIDTSQVEMAHLGATKYLMREVLRLEQLLLQRAT